MNGTAPCPADRPGRPVVAVFDFDGTLTQRDTFRMFLLACAGSRAAVAAAFARSPLCTAASLLGGARRDRAKEAMLVRLLGGRPAADVEAIAAALARRILLSELRPDVVARLRWHAAAGHEVIVVSASFDAYVRRVSTELGATAVYATCWETDPAGRLTGRLAGENVRGPRKAAVLAEHVAAAGAFVWAYGDSPGDRELLAAADVPVLVGRDVLPTPP